MSSLLLQHAFNKHVEDLVRNSKGVQRRYKGGHLLTSVKQELEAVVINRAAERLWEVLSAPEGFAPKLETCVLAALNKVHTKRVSELYGKEETLQTNRHATLGGGSMPNSEAPGNSDLQPR